MKIVHSFDANCGVHLMERKAKPTGMYYHRIVCEKLTVGDIFTSHTARTTAGFFEMEVKEIISEQKAKGNYKVPSMIYEAMLYLDPKSAPGEMMPGSF